MANFKSRSKNVKAGQETARCTTVASQMASRYHRRSYHCHVALSSAYRQCASYSVRLAPARHTHCLVTSQCVASMSWLPATSSLSLMCRRRLTLSPVTTRYIVDNCTTCSPNAPGFHFITFHFVFYCHFIAAYFYRASYASTALAVIVCLSVRLSVCPSVTSRSCTKIAKPYKSFILYPCGP